MIYYIMNIYALNILILYHEKFQDVRVEVRENKYVSCNLGDAYLSLTVLADFSPYLLFP